MADTKLKLTNVRLSYPFLFKPQESKNDDGTTTLKYGATLILDKKEHKAQIAKIRAAIKDKIDEHFNGNEKIVKGVCLRDGAERVNDDGTYKDGFGEEVMFVSASNKNRPQVINRNRSPLTAEDGVIYAGCYVNAVISLWHQQNKHGRRVNANILAIQFVKDGDPFGEAHVNVEEEFEDLDDGAEDSEENPLG